MFCRKCGAKIPDQAGFCPSCGQAVFTQKASGSAAPAEGKTRYLHLVPALITIIIIIILAVAIDIEPEGILLLLVLAFCAYALVVKPRILAKRIKKRLATGVVIPYQVNTSAISSILNTEPYSKDYIVKNEGMMETESGHKISFIDVITTHSSFDYKLKIVPLDARSSKLILEGSSTSKWELDGGFQVAKYYLEASELYRSLLHKFLPDYVDKNASEETEITWVKRYKYLATALIVLFIVYGICAAVLPSIVRNPVNDLQNIVFKEYGTLTLGEAADSTVKNQKWSSEKVDNNHYLVTLSGFQPDLYANFEATFDVTYADDYVYANINSVEYGGETYSDILSLSLVLGAIYSG